MNDRDYWLSVLERLARPVLEYLAARRLKSSMPVESRPGLQADRASFTHLEAIGRLLCGVAPWLELRGLSGAEEDLRAQFAALAREAIDAATDPQSPDFMNFGATGRQPIVDAAFLAQALLRAPNALWRDLPERVQANLVSALRSAGEILPYFNNWLLFSATVEAALMQCGARWDRMRVDYALRQHMHWYVGDGAYADGPEFHWDYYNAFVIQPMLVDVLTAAGDAEAEWARMRPAVLARARRYAAVQERMISPEGTIPPIGRSLAYRFGALQSLAQSALRGDLPNEPEPVTPAQVRCAMTAVIRRMIEAPGTFDAQGWLTIGFCGHQPGLGETYISTGSVYLCAAALLPLGLSPSHSFWADPPVDWTARRIYAGVDAPVDHALKGMHV
jgi:hypothetical protein